MTSETDVFQPEFRQLALPAAVATACIDGVACEDLVPMEIVRGGWPEFGWARLLYHPGVNAIAPEGIEERFAMGRTIGIHRLYNGRPPEVAVRELPLFAGQIEGIETSLDSDGERVHIVAKDFNAALGRLTVYGQRVLHADGSTVLLPDLATVFGPSGRGNAAQGQTHTVFCANPARAKVWTCAEAIDYLLSEYIPSGSLGRPGVDQLTALTGGRLLRALDVTGLSLLDALQRCSEAAGLAFRFVPRLADAGPAQAVVFYRPGRGRAIELNGQPAGESLSLARTSVATLHSRRTFYPVTHRYLGRGEFKTYEATFDLVKAWDPALESTAYEQFCLSANPQFDQVRDVYRRWCLNEAGDYTGAPYHRGDAYDFSAIFEHSVYAQRRRRFLPPLGPDLGSEPWPYLLEVRLDHAGPWLPCAYPFDVLTDECGIWLSSDALDPDLWVAFLLHAARFRITASVASDERLTCAVADGPVGSTVPVVEHVLAPPGPFAYRKVSSQSVPIAAAFGASYEVDDSAALARFVREYAAAAASATIETIDIRTLALLSHLEPGDRVMSSPDSRDWLNARRDGRSTTWIERVHVDFTNQCTHLRLIRQRLADHV